MGKGARSEKILRGPALQAAAIKWLALESTSYRTSLRKTHGFRRGATRHRIQRGVIQVLESYFLDLKLLGLLSLFHFSLLKLRNSRSPGTKRILLPHNKQGKEP